MPMPLSISKYWEISYRCTTRHHPVSADFRFWVRRNRSFHISITGDGVWAHSCLIVKKRIWPENSIWWESIIGYLNINRVNYSRKITHKYLLCRTTSEYCHTYVRVAAFWQSVFQNLLKLNVDTGVTLQSLIIFSTINAKIPHHETRKISNPHVENKYHRFTLHKSMIFFNRGYTKM